MVYTLAFPRTSNRIVSDACAAAIPKGEAIEMVELEQRLWSRSRARREGILGKLQLVSGGRTQAN